MPWFIATVGFQNEDNRFYFKTENPCFERVRFVLRFLLLRGKISWKQKSRLKSYFIAKKTSVEYNWSFCFSSLHIIWKWV